MDSNHEGLALQTDQSSWKAKTQTLIDFQHFPEIPQDRVNELRKALRTYQSWYEKFNNLLWELGSLSTGGPPVNLIKSAPNPHTEVRRLLDMILSSSRLPAITAQFDAEFEDFRSAVTSIRTNEDDEKTSDLWKSYLKHAEIMLASFEIVHANDNRILSGELEASIGAIRMEYGNLSSDAALNMSVAYQNDPGRLGWDRFPKRTPWTDTQRLC